MSLPKERTPLEEEIFEGLYEKHISLVKRKKYSAYKNAKSEAERTQTRKEYLDFIGVTQSFLSEEELKLK